VAESSTDIRDQVSTRHEKAARRRPVNMLTNGRRRCEIARGVNGSPLPRHQTASRLSDVMMRHGSDQYLPAAMSGMIICMLLLGAILVRSVGLQA
jgi:hypothetical protein